MLKEPFAKSFAAIVLAPALLLAQEATDVELPIIDTTITTLAPTTVIGSAEAVSTLPGSGFFVEPEAIRTAMQPNINRILTKVPGVYVREEDGYGNFPNISMRGGSTTRSEKVTVMEDGILTAPASYSAPGAYYSPKAGRMSGIEVLKGSSQVRFGPHTTGGVINYLSTKVPTDHTFYTRNTYGTDNTVLSHTYFGDVVESDYGRFGYVFELFYNQSDGFREIQKGSGYGGSDDTGFELIEPMFKFFWEPNTSIPQRFEGKYGYTDFDADESYLGLSEHDVRVRPYDRYAASRFDNIGSEHHRAYLKHIMDPLDNLRIETAGYYNHFKRNWYKLHDLRNVGGIPGNDMSLHSGLLDSAGLRTLKGRGPGDLRIRANNREYEIYGIQSQFDLDFDTGALPHELAGGFRAHHDEEFRFQRNDIASQGSSGAIRSFKRGKNGDAGDRIQETDAYAAWIEDAVSFGALTLKPGVRYEHVDQSYRDFANGDGGSQDLDIWAPGIGMTYDLTDSDLIFAGIYKGFSVPSPRDAIREGIEEEESIGYEVGYRHSGPILSGELVGFFTQFDNLIGSQTGGGGDTLNVNAGEADVAGVEALVSYDPLGTREGVGLPIYFSGTWTDTEHKEVIADEGESIFRGGSVGAELPYIPEWKLAAGIGVETEKWGINVDGSYVSSTFGTVKNLHSPGTSAREGIIDAAFLMDVTGHVHINENVKLIGGVTNVLDREYIVSRLPEGPRNGIPRQFFIGMEVTF